MSNIYSVDDIAEILKVSVKTIRRYIYSGKIAASKIGGQWRINQVQLDNYISSTSSDQICNSCSTDVSKDDFCIFMDTNYFDSNDKLQLCTIVDYYVDTIDDITKMSEVLLRVVTEDGVKGGKAQFNYVYDEPLKRARFVLWGSASFINITTNLLRPFEEESNHA